MENHSLGIGMVAGIGLTLGLTYFLPRAGTGTVNRHPPHQLTEEELIAKYFHKNNTTTLKKTHHRDRRLSLAELGSELGDDDFAIRHGFSMREAMEHNNQQAKHLAQRTPEEVLHSLQRGNTRFWMGVATRPEVSAFERRALIMRQHPSVAILGCADSRVPIEIVFDQGLGDVFTIRVAGNCMDTATEGTLEYAVLHLNVKVLIVLGHEGCGAIQAARLPLADLDKEPECLCDLLKSLKEGLDEERLNNIFDHRAADREAVVTNVKKQVGLLMNNDVVKNSVDAGNLKVLGAFYEMSSGIVDFYEGEKLNSVPTTHLSSLRRKKSKIMYSTNYATNEKKERS